MQDCHGACLLSLLISSVFPALSHKQPIALRRVLPQGVASMLPVVVLMWPDGTHTGE